mmetsp:Transcript_39334/g.111225  ORF Transcript_39334/g.111225 Transcript_39334/m.111225 type:complete len:228 (+) Transcript_39334:62-745(+)
MPRGRPLLFEEVAADHAVQRGTGARAYPLVELLVVPGHGLEGPRLGLDRLPESRFLRERRQELDNPVHRRQGDCLDVGHHADALRHVPAVAQRPPHGHGPRVGQPDEAGLGLGDRDAVDLLPGHGLRRGALEHVPEAAVGLVEGVHEALLRDLVGLLPHRPHVGELALDPAVVVVGPHHLRADELIADVGLHVCLQLRSDDSDNVDVGESPEPYDSDEVLLNRSTPL